MPTKKVNYCKDKAVLVRVYVEKPRKKRPSSNQHHQHHHHHLHYHIHQTSRQEVVQGSAGKGYDRRAELLMYSHLLRKSAREAPSTPSLTKWFPNNNRQTTTQIAPSQKKPAHAGRTTCFGNWKFLIASFLRSWPSAQSKERKKKQMHGGLSGNGMKKLEVKRERSFIPNVFSATRKRA